MKNQTIKKDQNNRSDDKQKARLRSIWLGVKDSNFHILIFLQIFLRAKHRDFAKRKVLTVTSNNG